MKLALLFRSYGPYHLARLRAAREYHSVLALEYADVDCEYDWDVRDEKRASAVVSLSSFQNGAGRAMVSRAKNLAFELRNFAPDAVAIPGYSEAFAISALRVCRALNIPVILMSDTHSGTCRRDPVRDFIKQKLVSLYQSALVAGSLHADYLVTFGFPAQKIAVGYDVIDNQHFAPALNERTAAKRKLKTKYFFCCARFIEKKNIPFLIDAFSRYRQSVPEDGWDLVIAGDGPLRETIERQRLMSQFSANIHLLGHKTYDELPALYHQAGAFVFPSLSDEWGLVVNEAMAAGLPVIVAKGAGCRPDLVQDGVNGFAFDPANIAELAAKMRALTAADDDRRAMGEASLRVIADWDVDRFAAGLSAAARMAVATTTKRNVFVGSAFAAALSLRS